MKPAKLGTIWPWYADIKIIDDSDRTKNPVWKTLARVSDTPKSINDKLKQLRKQGYKGFWSFGQASGKEYHG